MHILAISVYMIVALFIFGAPDFLNFSHNVVYLFRILSDSLSLGRFFWLSYKIFALMTSM